MLPILFNNEVAEEGERRSGLHCILGQMIEKKLPIGDGFGQVAAQVVGQGEIAVTGPEIEEDGGVHHLLGFGVDDPGVEGFLPGRGAHPPLGVAGHHLAGAEGVTAFDQILYRLFAQELKITLGRRRLLLVIRPGVDQGVVLVGFEGLFTAPLAAHQQPAEGERRRPQLFDQQGQEPLQDMVVEDGDHPGDVVGLGPLLDQAADYGGHLAGQGVEPLQAALGHDLPEEIERRGPLEQHNIVGGDHPDNFALSLHCQVMNPLAHHSQHGVEADGVGGDGLDRGGHNLGHRGLVIKPGRHHFGPQIFVGDNADNFAAGIGNQQGSDPQLGHPGGGGLDRLGGGDGLELAFDAGPHLAGEEKEGAFGAGRYSVAAQFGIGGVDQLLREAAQKVVAHLGGGVQEMAKGGLGEEKAEGILHRLHVEVGPGILDNRQGPEIFALAPEILKADLPLVVDQINFDAAFLDQVKVFYLRLPLAEDHAPFGEEIDHAVAGQLP